MNVNSLNEFIETIVSSKQQQHQMFTFPQADSSANCSVTPSNIVAIFSDLMKNSGGINGTISSASNLNNIGNNISTVPASPSQFPINGTLLPSTPSLSPQGSAFSPFSRVSNSFGSPIFPQSGDYSPLSSLYQHQQQANSPLNHALLALIGQLQGNNLTAKSVNSSLAQTPLATVVGQQQTQQQQVNSVSHLLSTLLTGLGLPQQQQPLGINNIPIRPQLTPDQINGQVLRDAGLDSTSAAALLNNIMQNHIFQQQQVQQHTQHNSPPNSSVFHQMMGESGPQSVDSVHTQQQQTKAALPHSSPMQQHQEVDSFRGRLPTNPQLETPVRKIRRRRPKPGSSGSSHQRRNSSATTDSSPTEPPTAPSSQSQLPSTPMSTVESENNGSDGMSEGYSPPSLIQFHNSGNICPGSDNNPVDNDNCNDERNKKCRVCGDKATGYNFNVISCESCKAFFRRNALRPKDFKCPYTSNCEIDTNTRRFCQKCRLKKCFDVGMKKEWILSDDQLRRRKNARIRSHAASHNQQQQGQGFGQGASSPCSTNTSQPSPEDVILGMMSPCQNPYSPVINGSGGVFSAHQSPIATLLELVSPGSMIPKIQSPPFTLTNNFNGTFLPEASAFSKSPLNTEEKNILNQIQKSVPIVSDEKLFTSVLTCTTTEEAKIIKNEPKDDSCFDQNSSTPITTSPVPGVGVIIESEDLKDAKTKKMIYEFIGEALNSLTMGKDAMTPSTEDKKLDDYKDIKVDDLVKIEIHKTALTPEEKHEIDTVESAYECMEEPVEENTISPIVRTACSKMELDPKESMHLAGFVIRRIVKVVLKLSTFNQLSKDGQFVLLKESMVNLLSLRGMTLFDEKKRCWKSKLFGNTEISVDIFDKLNDPKQKNRFINFCKTLNEKLRKDIKTIHIIGLLALFNNWHQCVAESDKEVAKSHYNKYMHLLERYLEATYGDEEAKKLFFTVPTALQELSVVSAIGRTIFRGRVQEGDVDPLSSEIFKSTN